MTTIQQIKERYADLPIASPVLSDWEATCGFHALMTLREIGLITGETFRNAIDGVIAMGKGSTR